jgi:hypothetical protein
MIRRLVYRWLQPLIQEEIALTLIRWRAKGNLK